MQRARCYPRAPPGPPHTPGSPSHPRPPAHPRPPTGALWVPCGIPGGPAAFGSPPGKEQRPGEVLLRRPYKSGAAPQSSRRARGTAMEKRSTSRGRGSATSIAGGTGIGTGTGTGRGSGRWALLAALCLALPLPVPALPPPVRSLVPELRRSRALLEAARASLLSLKVGDGQGTGWCPGWGGWVGPGMDGC